jgi:hypothetical protein
MLVKEHEYTRSGEVDDAQIKKIGKQFGAQYLCIVEINVANRGYYLAAQLVDVESARIINSASAGSRLENYNEQMAVAKKIALELVGDAEGQRTQPASPASELPRPEGLTRTVDFTSAERWGTWAWNLFPGLGSYVIMDDKKGALINVSLFVAGGLLALLGVSGDDSNIPIVASGFVIGFGAGSVWNIYRSAAYHHPMGKPKKPSIPSSFGAGGLFANNVGGGVDLGDGGEIAMPYTAGGGYLCLDLAYLELAAGFAGGGGKWKSYDTNYPEYLPDMSRTYMTFSALMKLPFGGERVKIFPLLGADYEMSLSAELKNGLSGVKKPGNGDLSTFWYKVGAGLDINLRQNMYLRAEALYGLRMPNAYEDADYEYRYGDGHSYGRSGDGLTLKAGVGLNIVKRQANVENENKNKNTNEAASGQKEEK